MTEPLHFDAQKYVYDLLAPLLDDPANMDVRVSSTESGSVTTIEVYAATPKDLGIVIGQYGSTFKAVEMLLKKIRFNRRWKKTNYVLRVPQADEEE
jgi:predicted RNA-binding protein YlqC (UPF0109 family)